MARILVYEPASSVRALLEILVASLGHEAIPLEPSPPDPLLLEGDLLLVEPAEGVGLALAQRLRRNRPDAPIVCISSRAPTPELLALEPLAFLVKPFTSDALRHALETALRISAAAGG